MKRHLILIVPFLLIVMVVCVLFIIIGVREGQEYKKQDIIKAFNMASEKFERIGQFCDNEKLNLIISHKGKEIRIETYTDDGKIVENDNINSIYNDALYILKDLKFENISGSQNYVRFIAYSNIKENIGHGYEKGIAYSKSSAEPKLFDSVEHIADDKWYYYFSTYE